MEIRVQSDIDYYKVLAEIYNLDYRHREPGKVIKGRELQLLTLYAAASERFPSLKGAGLQEWLKENGRFTANDIYRYTSRLLTKGWISEGYLKMQPAGGYQRYKSPAYGAVEAYLLPTAFDKKATSLNTKFEINVAATDQAGKTKS